MKEMMDETVRDLLSTQRENGSISCVEIDSQPEQSELWERKYVMLGLEAYYEWVNPDPAVLDALKKQADNIIDIIGHAPKTEITDIGWSATNIGHEPCHIESSTLLEPFMHLYNRTGEQRYLDFATYIFESGGTKHYNVFEMALDNVEPYKMAGNYPKAYEMTSLFEGLVEYYRVTAKPEIKQMILNYYQNIRTREITLIGNGGCDRPYHPQVAGEAWGNTAVEQTNPDITRMMETCTGVTWMKFCSLVLRLTGDPSAVDEIEKYVYNGLTGAMKPTGDGFSYVNLLNGPKVNGKGWGWMFDDLHVTCCNLNGPMGLAYIPFVAVMNSGEGPVVNLYGSGTADLKSPRNRALKLDIVTDYPQSGKILIHVKPAQKEKFNLKLRIPGWSGNTVVRVNGESSGKVNPGTYHNILRQWQAGDQVEIEFEMNGRLIHAPKGSHPASEDFRAVTWGPVVLARDQQTDSGFNKPVRIISDAGGLVKIQKVRPTLPGTQMEFIVPVEDGEIRMSDYASVNGWQGSHVCTWLPLK
ncbi:MAG: glycoside hydrolase family 127 protein [Tannerella sp.]|nr:glycoside hydrolase family 127 protein [Tannerella sp.]